MGTILTAMLPLALLLAAEPTSGVVRVNPARGGFEEAGEGPRELYFHGVNYVRKTAPYIADPLHCGSSSDAELPPCPPPIPCPTGIEPNCPSTWLLTDDDARFLVQRGVNVVRIGVMWPGAMPDGPDSFNASYFEQVERVVGLLWSHRVHTILDLHQDVLSPALCGEGAPRWVNVSQAALGGLPFPLPLQPTPVATLPSGLPNCSALAGFGFQDLYATDSCGRAFAAIYADTAPQHLGTQLANFWGEVARRFRGNDGVLALELINEP